MASVSGGRGGTARTLGVTSGGGTVGSSDSSHLHDFPGNGGAGPDPPDSLDVGIVSNNIGAVERDPEECCANRDKGTIVDERLLNVLAKNVVGMVTVEGFYDV